MSDDGRTFFTTTDPLVDADVNGLRDTYEYVDGRPQLISTGLTTHRLRSLSAIFKAGLVGVSHDGVDVYFATYETLVAQDHNGQFLRFYDARINGGFPFRAAAARRAPPPTSATAPAARPPIAPEITSGAKLGKGGNVVKQKQKKHEGEEVREEEEGALQEGPRRQKKAPAKRGADR